MHEYTYCGLDCANCDYKERCNCKGCKSTKGEPFHGICKLAKCAISNNANYCFECKSYPCALLKAFAYDPEHGDNGKRIETLEDIKTSMVGKI